MGLFIPVANIPILQKYRLAYSAIIPELPIPRKMICFFSAIILAIDLSCS